MSKISVFKFNINQISDHNIINSIIGNYLNNNGFSYNNDEKCYMVGTASEQEANLNVAKEIVVDMAMGNPFIHNYGKFHPCFECKIENNQLIIKAYTLNAFAGIKSYIHSSVNTNMAGREYYNNLKTNLFNQLQQNNIQLISTETEKIKDKSSSKLLKKLIIIILPIIVLFGLIALFSYLSNN